MLAIVCPGQGSQSPGFLETWLELPGAEDRLNWLSAVAGLDLLAHGTTSDEATIRDTAIAQPLIVAAGLITLACLQDGDAVSSPEPHPVADVVAGHSVGEFTAAVLAGVLTAEQSLVLVRERGQAMARASAASAHRDERGARRGSRRGGRGDRPARPGAGEPQRRGPGRGGGQSGGVGRPGGRRPDPHPDRPPDGRRRVPHPPHGVRLRRVGRLRPGPDPGTPLMPLLSNADGGVVTDGRDALARMADQISLPVRWDACMATMADLGVTGLLELAPAGALAGLAKRGLPGVEVVALRTPDDLDAARTLVRAHRDAPRATHGSGGPA